MALAIELARRGVAFRIVDASAGPSVHSKALAVQPRTLEVLDMMGGQIADQSVARSQRLDRLNVFAFGKKLGSLRIQGTDSRFGTPIIIEQSETERLLIERLEALGTRIERSATMTSFAQDRDGVDASVRRADGGVEHIRARWIVGCDGAHSAVRHGLSIAFTGNAYEERFILADVRVDWSFPPGEGFAFMGQESLCAAIPMRGEARYRLIGMRAPSAETPEGDPTLAEAQELLERLAPVSVRVSDPVWLQDFRLHRRLAERFRVGRAFLAGDAAHIHSPAGGQGMNTGIQDAFNLGWKLALVISGLGCDELLDTYEYERMPVARAVLRLTDAIFKMVLSRNRFTWKLRGWLVPSILERNRIAQRIGLALSELDISYQGSPIVGPPPRWLASFKSTATANGDRFPDVSLTRLSDGTGVRLFELLRDPRHMVIRCGFEDASRQTIENVESMVKRFEAAFGASAHMIEIRARDTDTPVSDHRACYLDNEGAFIATQRITAPALLLIRPDGHLGLRAGANDRLLLGHYLNGLLRSEHGSMDTE